MKKQPKYRILFVCWGNICRSPMAEFILKDMVQKRGLQDQFLIESAAHSSEEIGNPVYPRPGGNWPATASPATASAPGRSPGRTTRNTTGYWAWSS